MINLLTLTLRNKVLLCYFVGRKGVLPWLPRLPGASNPNKGTVNSAQVAMNFSVTLYSCGRESGDFGFGGYAIYLFLGSLTYLSISTCTTTPWGWWTVQRCLLTPGAIYTLELKTPNSCFYSPWQQLPLVTSLHLNIFPSTHRVLLSIALWFLKWLYKFE